MVLQYLSKQRQRLQSLSQSFNFRVPTLSSAKLAPVGTAAVLAGICALIQELIWVRRATLAFGLSVQAYAAVVVVLDAGDGTEVWRSARTDLARTAPVVALGRVWGRNG